MSNNHSYYFPLGHISFKYVYATLTKMNMMQLVTINQDYMPDLVNQFFCTVFFHDDDDRSMTWMTGNMPHTTTFEQFQAALGYDALTQGGFRIHSQKSMHDSSLAFCYPLGEPDPPLPQITAMYYFYNTMARIYRSTIVSKSGDFQSCTKYAKNLMYYTHPDHQQRIDVPDYIYNELKTAVERRMSPKYHAYVMCLLNLVVPSHFLVGRIEKHELLNIPLRKDRVEVPSMVSLPSEHGSKSRHDPRAASSSSVQPKRGAAKFFKKLFSMCKQSYDVSHRSLKLSQRNLELIIADRLERGLPPPTDIPEMAHVSDYTFDMPPLTDAMLAGIHIPEGTDEDDESGT